jgi:hypothetical protein
VASGAWAGWVGFDCRVVGRGGAGEVSKSERDNKSTRRPLKEI